MNSKTTDLNAAGSASHLNMFEHVPGPLRPSARAHEIAIDAGGTAAIEWSVREPLVVVRLAASLAEDALQLELMRDPGGANETLPPLRFAPYTEFGASLPAHLPPVDETTRHAAPLSLGLRLRRIAPDGTDTAVPAAELGDWLKIEVLEGILARVAYILGSEHMRMRRVAREIMAMRQLTAARDSALDRIGAALAVPRLTDEIDFDAATLEVITRSTDPAGHPILESDAAYRRRLGIYQPRLYPSHGGLSLMVNGPGDAGDPNRGLLGALGVTERFRFVEADSPFAFAVHVIATGSDAARINFLNHLRNIVLIAPRRALEQTRYLSSGERDRQQALRTRLNQSFQFGMDDYIAPMLAEALDRVARCRTELLGGALGTRQIQRAQDPAGGSRYELGLGLDLQPLTQAERTSLRDALLDPNRAPAADSAVEGTLRDMAALPPPTADEDPDAAWFFRACGFRTVHRINNARLYLSHLPTAGLLIQGVSSLNPGDHTVLTAHYHSPGDPGSNVRLVESIKQAADAWTALGGAAWTELTPAQGRDRWQNAVVNANAANVFNTAGLPALDPAADQVEDRLSRVPDELLTTLRLAPAQSAEILAGDASAAPRLTNLVRVLSEAGIVSVLPLATAPNQVILVCSVIGLPGVGANLGPRRASGFRWYTVPIQGAAGQVGAMGGRTTFTAATAPALAAVVAVGYARDPALTDPYEFRVQLPEAAHLNLRQYEFLMNLLEHAHPAGVEINTWRIRQQHIDLDGDGRAEPINPRIARAYRQFRRIRHRGEFGVGIEE
ncbi:MAG: hypothetical protein JJT90_12265 [Ectothiorhodospiraceae bacterium]|nr:hypothetical protein [Ectothiorhodospiraceae bacterium]